MRRMTREGYEKLHREHEGYQNNNWLIEEADIESLVAFDVKTVFEIGCGNGRFLAYAMPLFESVFGCDWAIPNEPDKGRHRIDIEKDLLPIPSDCLIVSADVLEHIPEENLPAVITKITAASTKQYHIIACYDDGFSHETVKSPKEWLQLFRAADKDYIIENSYPRRRNPSKPIVVITKGRPEIRVNWGCGPHKRAGYTNIDENPDVRPDICGRAQDVVFRNFTVDEVYSRHMLEHLTSFDAHLAVHNWFDCLKPGGLLHIVVPDIIFHAHQLIGGKDLAHAMAGFYGWDNTHRYGYTEQSLPQILCEAGFADVRRVFDAPDSSLFHLQIKARKPMLFE